jgi:hypothetical protein
MLGEEARKMLTTAVASGVVVLVIELMRTSHYNNHQSVRAHSNIDLAVMASLTL